MDVERALVSATRIAMSGSAGTGKTTLGRRYAEEHGLCYVEEGMRRRIEGGFKLYELDERGHRELMREMWSEQREAEERATQGFVSDRSSVDFAAFWLHYNLVDAEDETREFLDEMAACEARYEAVLLLPWGALPLNADGVRSTNRWLQLKYQTLVEGLHARWTRPERLHRIPSTDDFEARLSFVREALAP